MVSLKAAVCISDLMYVLCAINKPERPLFFAVCVRDLFVVFLCSEAPCKTNTFFLPEFCLH